MTLLNRGLQILAVVMLSVIGQNAYAVLDVSVVGGGSGAQPMAFVPFATPPEFANLDLVQIIENDLKNVGLAEPLSRSAMLSKPSEVDKVDPAFWKRVGSDYLIIGSVNRGVSGGAVVRYFLVDIVKGEQRLGFEMPEVSVDLLRTVAHQISDQIYEELTGIKGIFNTQIAYVSAQGYGDARRWELLIADADGFDPHSVDRSAEPISSPVWSPDGTKIAYVTYQQGRMGIYVYTLATGERRRIVSEKGLNSSPTWSPDGRKLLVTLSFETNPDLYEIELATGKRRQLTNHFAIDTEASYSPDGRQIAFLSDRGGTPQVYLMPVSGGEPKRLTFLGTQNLRPRFSPDGKTLAMVTKAEGAYVISVLDLFTEEQTVISQGPDDQCPSFAPNGAAIIYAAQNRGGAELAVTAIDGRYQQRLRADGGIQEPSWAPFSR